MFTITKEVYFCYGHRLMRHPGKCRHLHGHSVKAAITVQAAGLNEQGMVCDFADIARIASDYIDRELDHNLLLHRDDPLVPLLAAAGERYSLLDEHPTAEYLAQLIYRHAQSQGLAVASVTLWETASACATYSEP
ncbi:6-pyruvoyltetrahydropterin/6-carboxytetrahydropterin synthase [Methylomagnum ishizawai]|uniref:6-carboxy-5,6,7,8-tetrahydropterin synthase n=1 Tax=Methylomagnum ishizawai TaxID=1760988 RepID=A0A1Y6D9T8_9GAMM|nr:6-carboxytetrahydropterin synthase [Methylomagnum ishizawai]SMF96485.1 6-pyruvoyltetrahydropterin/6-carboxytetrahydropterin synthase [Methylomagnum ishizawai]